MADANDTSTELPDFLNMMGAFLEWTLWGFDPEFIEQHFNEDRRHWNDIPEDQKVIQLRIIANGLLQDISNRVRGNRGDHVQVMISDIYAMMDQVTHFYLFSRYGPKSVSIPGLEYESDVEPLGPPMKPPAAPPSQPNTPAASPLVWPRHDEADLVRRATTAYLRTHPLGRGAPQPGNASGVTEVGADVYAVLRNIDGILAVYRLQRSGTLKRMQIWPKAVEHG
jgi:hypothetical protein